MLKPHLKDLPIGSLIRAGLVDGAVIRDLHAQKPDLAEAKAKNVLFEHVKITKGTFLNADLASAHFANAVFEDCEMSAMLTPKASVQRTEFKSCRLMGWQVGEAFIEDVLFEDCKLDLANFRFCTFKDVVFKNCMLKGADFQGASFTKATMQGCDLAGAEFRQCSVKILDLRTSSIADIRYVEGLKGATIDPTQLMDIAPQLANIAGLDVDY